MLFFGLIDLHSSTVISFFYCGSISLRNSIFNFNWQAKTLFFRFFFFFFFFFDPRSSTVTSVMIADNRGRRQSKTVVIDHERISKIHRNSVFDCNWKSKTLFFRLIGPRSSTVMNVFDCWLSGKWQAKSAVTDDEPGSKRLRNWQSKMQF